MIEISTISGNTAPSGTGSGVTFVGDTFTRTEVRNSIIAGNTNTDVDTVGNGDNSFQSNGFNLIGDGNATSAFNQSGDQVIGDASPGLDTLKDNGGPTQTIALLAGSPAIDKGNSTLSTDQRGEPRPFNDPGIPPASGGNNSDIGAFERQQASNSAPTVSDIAVSVDEDGTLVFSAAIFDGGFSDPDANTLQSVRIDTLPANGTLRLNGVPVTAGQIIARADLSNLTYVPNANYNGADAFTYNASDGTLAAATGATVRITVKAVNDAPTAKEDSASTSALTPVKIAVLSNDIDVDGDTLSIQSVTQPARGSVAINSDGTLTYTGDGTLGEDSFSYTISDGQGGTTTAKVTVTRTLPQSTPNAKVTGSGAIRVAGGSASFSLSVQVKNGTPTGNVSFDNSPGGVFVRSLRITAIVLNSTGTTARIYGTAKVNGAGSIAFFVEAEDAGEPGVGADTFRIVAGSYSAQGVLSSGNIQVHKVK